MARKEGASFKNDRGSEDERDNMVLINLMEAHQGVVIMQFWRAAYETMP